MPEWSRAAPAKREFVRFNSDYGFATSVTPWEDELKFKRLLAALGITVLGIVGTLAVTAAPAQATACSSGQLCTYWNVMSGDPMYYYTTPIWTCLNIGSTWNNQISSIDNRRDFTITIWDDYGCASGSRHVTLGPSTYIYDLGWPDLFNDRASSISFGW